MSSANAMATLHYQKGLRRSIGELALSLGNQAQVARYLQSAAAGADVECQRGEEVQLDFCLEAPIANPTNANDESRILFTI